MEEITGGKDVNYWLCNAAFIQLGAWNALAFGLAGMTGAGIIAGVIIGVTAAAVC